MPELITSAGFSSAGLAGFSSAGTVASVCWAGFSSDGSAGFSSTGISSTGYVDYADSVSGTG